MSRYVIIGNSAAAIGCVEGIRQMDKTSSITLVVRRTAFYLFPSADFLSAVGKNR